MDLTALVAPLATAAAALYLLPLVFAAAAAGLALVSPAGAVAWRWAHGSACAALLLAVLAFAGLLAGGARVLDPGLALRSGGFEWLSLAVRSDAVGAPVLLLVAFIGWVIVRYSRTALAGEARETAYAARLLATLAAVSTVLVTNHLLVLALAWMATSRALQGLLTFYGERQAARIAAHKKFLMSLLAGWCLLTALVLIGATLGTLQIDAVLARAAALPVWPPAMHAAVVLLAATALLKCAQLPWHGWLIQVMEAPTPVSALLHAGVVNLGGFVLIRLAGLVTGVPAAQALLVLAGTLTAVLAALVMSTRISIKVSLAWSTCAQMGFMLMQCGLGLPEMALLHLLAHSLYKAHAFLGAGGAVQQAQRQQLLPAATAPGLAPLLASAGLGLVLVGAAARLAGVWVPSAYPGLGLPASLTPLLALAVVVALALTPLLAARLAAVGSWRALGLVAAAAGLALGYFALHAAFAAWLAGFGGGGGGGGGGAAAAGPAPAAVMPAFVVAAFAALFAMQTAIQCRPAAAWSRRLYPFFYAGLFIDDRLTRTSFAIWPLRPGSRGPAPAASVATPVALPVVVQPKGSQP